MRLYTYFRSSAAYRVRIALNLKGLPYEVVPVHLLRDGGQQNQAEYCKKSPLGIVPSLQTDTGVLTQSLAIIEWLDETYSQVPMLPADADGRARVRVIAQTIATPSTTCGCWASRTEQPVLSRQFGKIKVSSLSCPDFHG